jgi:hypothetical protein
MRRLAYLLVPGMALWLACMDTPVPQSEEGPGEDCFYVGSSVSCGNPTKVAELNPVTTCENGSTCGAGTPGIPIRLELDSALRISIGHLPPNGGSENGVTDEAMIRFRYGNASAWTDPHPLDSLAIALGDSISLSASSLCAMLDKPDKACREKRLDQFPLALDISVGVKAGGTEYAMKAYIQGITLNAKSGTFAWADSAYQPKDGLFRANITTPVFRMSFAGLPRRAGSGDSATAWIFFLPGTPAISRICAPDSALNLSEVPFSEYEMRVFPISARDMERGGWIPVYRLEKIGDLPLDSGRNTVTRLQTSNRIDSLFIPPKFSPRLVSQNCL